MIPLLTLLSAGPALASDASAADPVPPQGTFVGAWQESLGCRLQSGDTVIPVEGQDAPATCDAWVGALPDGVVYRVVLGDCPAGAREPAERIVKAWRLTPSVDSLGKPVRTVTFVRLGVGSAAASTPCTTPESGPLIVSGRRITERERAATSYPPPAAGRVVNGLEGGEVGGVLGGVEGGVVGGVVGGVEGGMVGGEIGGSLDGAVPIHHSKLQIRRRIQPTYPEAAKAMNLGRVDCRVRVFIDETGKPYDVRMHACPKMFHDTTREALYKWRWYPARKDGQKVKVATMLKIRFQTE